MATLSVYIPRNKSILPYQATLGALLFGIVVLENVKLFLRGA